jgi:hypothetical protein
VHTHHAQALVHVLEWPIVMQVRGGAPSRTTDTPAPNAQPLRRLRLDTERNAERMSREIDSLGHCASAGLLPETGYNHAICSFAKP